MRARVVRDRAAPATCGIAQMVVYGHRSFELHTRPFLEGLHARIAGACATTPSHSMLHEWLVDVGEAEAAVADALMPEIESESEALCAWREIAGGIAAATCASWYGDAEGIAPALLRARCGIEGALRQPGPACVHARTAEGFACYSLYPEQYMRAAEQMLAYGRAQSVFCLGLRSIGAILAHVVGATLQRGGACAIVRSARPRGQPFDRHLRCDRSIEKLITECRCDIYAVIDEGPGLSGSSFAAGAEQLHSLGIPHDRIFLVPAWNADPERMKSDRGRRTWETHRRVVGDFNPFERHDDSVDLSAGRWRSQVFTGDLCEWPAVHPQHERPKFLNTSDRGIARFAGIGKTAARRRSRAETLHGAGFGARVVDVRDGVLEMEWVDGRQVLSPSAACLSRAADYISLIRSHFRTGVPEDLDELKSMIEANGREAGLALDVATVSGDLPPAGERIAVDGRMMLHEWIETPTGFVKVDALDHHDDDFFPACRDIAWDVAGVCVECDLDAQAAEHFISRYRRSSGDDDIGLRLPFYELAYAAYRLGYARLASESVGDEAESARFRRLEMSYANRLRRFQRSA